MSKVLLLFGFCLICGINYSQQLPPLPLPIGAGTSEVWGDTIFHFGGSSDWGGSIQYPRVYKFDGTQWSYYDTIPDNNMWGVTSVISGNSVYLFGAWPSGPSLARRYDLNTRLWTYLAESPNTVHTWGITTEVFGGVIYLFNPDGECFAYNISTNSWSTKASNNATGSRDLNSILYNNEIYIIGWDNSEMYKYNPSSNQWTQLASSTYQVGACAIGIINNLIYMAGGNVGGAANAQYNSILVYDILSNTWSLDQLELSSKRHWMATAEYKGGLYVIGGIDSASFGVNTVEQIVPQGTSDREDEDINPADYTLLQNFPNPFNPETIIKFTLPRISEVLVEIYDILGNKIQTILNEEKTAGSYELRWSGENLPSGIYFYRLSTGEFTQSKKMILMR